MILIPQKNIEFQYKNIKSKCYTLVSFKIYKFIKIKDIIQKI